MSFSLTLIHHPCLYRQASSMLLGPSRFLSHVKSSPLRLLFDTPLLLSLTNFENVINNLSFKTQEGTYLSGNGTDGLYNFDSISCKRFSFHLFLWTCQVPKPNAVAGAIYEIS